MNIEFGKEQRYQPTTQTEGNPITQKEATVEAVGKFTKDSILTNGDVGTLKSHKDILMEKESVAIKNIKDKLSSMFDDIETNEKKDWDTGGGKWKPL